MKNIFKRSLLLMSRTALVSRGVIVLLRGEQEVIGIKSLAHLKKLNSNINKREHLPYISTASVIILLLLPIITYKYPSICM